MNYGISNQMSIILAPYGLHSLQCGAGSIETGSNQYHEFAENRVKFD